MPYSSIVKKKCKCGCEKYPTISFDGYYYAHAPQEIKDRQGLKAKRGYQNKLNKAKANNLSKKVKSFAKGEDAFRDGGKSKSELLKLADKLFGDFIKNRDKFPVIDEETGDVVDLVSCPCCYKTYDTEAKGADGTKIVNVLHFIDRDVYLLRYDEDFAAAGCSYCNLKQHLNPQGQEYQNFRKFLVNRFGEEHVAEAEVAHRKINRIETQMLHTVIELYS